MCVCVCSYFSEHCSDAPSLLTTSLPPSWTLSLSYLPPTSSSQTLSWVHTFHRFPCFPPADRLSPHASASSFRFYSLPSVPSHQGCHSEQNSGTKLGPKLANRTKAEASKSLKLKQLFLIKMLSFFIIRNSSVGWIKSLADCCRISEHSPFSNMHTVKYNPLLGLTKTAFCSAAFYLLYIFELFWCFIMLLQCSLSKRHF